MITYGLATALTLAGIAVGGFAGCGLMAVRHARSIGRIEGEYRADIAALTREVSQLVQPSIGTDKEAETFRIAKLVYTRFDAIERNNGRS